MDIGGKVERWNGGKVRLDWQADSVDQIPVLAKSEIFHTGCLRAHRREIRRSQIEQLVEMSRKAYKKPHLSGACPHKTSTIFPGQLLPSFHAGIVSNSSDGRFNAAHRTNSPYSSLVNDLLHEIAQRPLLGVGNTFRFSTRLISSKIRIAYGPVQVKAEVIIQTLPSFQARVRRQKNQD